MRRSTMGEKRMSGEINQDRRRLVGGAALAVAAAQLGMVGAASAQSGTKADKRSASASMGPIKQIEAGVLNVGYAEAGSPGGKPVILLHGWPYDIHTYVDVMPLLAAAAYRVIVPYLRGYGSTSFLSRDTFRNAQPTAVASDVIALMDALKIDKTTLGGCDWGARTVCIMAVLWPERVKSIVSVSGYLIGNQE